MAVVRQKKTSDKRVSGSLLTTALFTASSSSLGFSSDFSSSSFTVGDEVYGRHRPARVQHLATPLAKQAPRQHAQVFEELHKLKEGVDKSLELHNKIGELKRAVCLEGSGSQMVNAAPAQISIAAAREAFQGFVAHGVAQAPVLNPMEGDKIVYALFPGAQAAAPPPAVASPVQAEVVINLQQGVQPATSVAAPPPAAPLISAAVEGTQKLYTLVPGAQIATQAAVVAPVPAAEVIYQLAQPAQPSTTIAAPAAGVAPAMQAAQTLYTVVPGAQIAVEAPPAATPIPAPVSTSAAVSAAVELYTLTQATFQQVASHPTPVALPTVELSYTQAVQPVAVTPAQGVASWQETIYRLTPAVSSPIPRGDYSRLTLGKGSPLCVIATELQKMSGQMLKGEQGIFENELQKALQNPGVRAAARAHQLQQDGGFPVLNDGAKDGKALVNLMDSGALNDATKRVGLEKAARLNAGLEALLGNVATPHTPEAAREWLPDYSEFDSSELSSSAFA